MIREVPTLFISKSNMAEVSREKRKRPETGYFKDVNEGLRLPVVKREKKKANDGNPNPKELDETEVSNNNPF